MPSIVIEPALSSCRRKSVFMMVDLPAPVRPTTARGEGGQNTRSWCRFRKQSCSPPILSAAPTSKLRPLRTFGRPGR